MWGLFRIFVYMYRTPTKKELYIGMPIEFRVHGEYDMEVCTFSKESYESYLFNDEYTGWKWEERLLDEEWFSYFKEWDGDDESVLRGKWRGLPTLGFIRVKQTPKTINNETSETTV
jgi:hypothetical protein